MIRFLVLIALIAHCITQSESRQLWADVFNGQHFDDAVGNEDYLFMKPTVLIMYRPECVPQNITKLPSQSYLLVFGYDMENANKHIWYEPKAGDDLYKRYGDKRDSCVIAMYFDKDQPLNSKPYYWEPEEYEDPELEPWILDFVRVTLKFTSTLDQTIRMKETKEDGSVVTDLFYPDEELSYDTYMGNLIEFEKLQPRQTIYRLVVTKHVDITIKENMKSFNTDIQRQFYEEEKVWWENWIYQTSLRHTLMLKQPLFVHNYTTKGYRTHSVPLTVFNVLYKYLHDNYRERQELSFGANQMLLSNRQEIKASLVQLDTRVAWDVAEILRPLLQNWCRCSLRFSESYGIWQFYRGTQLNKMVDDFTKHAISAAILIEQDINKGNKEVPWSIELVGYNGKQEILQLKQRKMLIYESAKLIHGWPYTFKGKGYSIVFFHFLPTTGWDYYYEGTYLKNYDGRAESLSHLATDLTKERTMFKSRVRDEL